MSEDRLSDLEFAPERDLVEILAVFIGMNLDEHEQNALVNHERRIEAGTVYRGSSRDGQPGRWIDWEYDSDIATCRAHRNIASWGRQTHNRWLLGQIAILYSGHPDWNDSWVDGVKDEYQNLT